MKSIKTFILALSCLFLPLVASAHCEIPCGIYNDSLRITLLYEHVTTIEKSMTEIIRLEKSGSSTSQLVRWVYNKEEHAKKMQEIISQYFMHQRIKPKSKSDKGYAIYISQLEYMHRLSILSMNAKQGLDLDIIEKMRMTIHDFEHVYFK